MNEESLMECTDGSVKLSRSVSASSGSGKWWLLSCTGFGDAQAASEADVKVEWRWQNAVPGRQHEPVCSVRPAADRGWRLTSRAVGRWRSPDALRRCHVQLSWRRQTSEVVGCDTGHACGSCKHTQPVSRDDPAWDQSPAWCRAVWLRRRTEPLCQRRQFHSQCLSWHAWHEYQTGRLKSWSYY